MAIGGTFKLKIGTIHPASELRRFGAEGREASPTTAASAGRRPDPEIQTCHEDGASHVAISGLKLGEPLTL